MIGTTNNCSLAPNIVHGVDQAKTGISMPTHVLSGLVFRQPQFALFAKYKPGGAGAPDGAPTVSPGCVTEPASVEPAVQSKRAPANAKFIRLLLVLFSMIDTSVPKTNGTGDTLQL